MAERTIYMLGLNSSYEDERHWMCYGDYPTDEQIYNFFYHGRDVRFLRLRFDHQFKEALKEFEEIYEDEELEPITSSWEELTVKEFTNLTLNTNLEVYLVNEYIVN